MKKIFTLLLGMGSLTAVFAQSGHSRNERNQPGDYGYGQSQSRTIYDKPDRRNDDYSFNRERDAQIQRINWDFDNRIQAIKRDWFMRNGQKMRQIRMLENQRMEQIRQTNERFSRSRTVFYDNRSYKSNGSRY